MKNKKKFPNSTKKFFSIKEFSRLTGIPFSTIVHLSAAGKIKGRISAHNRPWEIYASELDRYKSEAENSSK